MRTVEQGWAETGRLDSFPGATLTGDKKAVLIELTDTRQPSVDLAAVCFVDRRFNPNEVPQDVIGAQVGVHTQQFQIVQTRFMHVQKVDPFSTKGCFLLSMTGSPILMH